EIAISRRLERDGEGEYRLNGARCRLVDVLEVLSDTGLGREMHSVVSQGRVEAIVHSKPRDRRLLIEEAAGLGKHRKRRRRAQLKLERTEDNVARVLDVEREARSRLRPLKRQAEAAELHERLRRQWLEARLELLQDACAASLRDLAALEEELGRVEARLEEQGGQALASLKAERKSAARQLEELDSVLDARRRELVEAEEAAEHARAARIAADRAAEAAAERAATARAE